MAQAPPGPPGGQPPFDPYAADRALAQWAAARGYTLSAQPDLAWYQGWFPCVYLARPVRVGREVRATFGDATVWAAETFEADTLKQATGEDRHLLVFLTSQRLGARAALRSRQGGGMVNEISSGLDSLFGKKPQPGSVLGDPTLEARYDATTPSREEGNRALPMGLRQLLLQSGWRGILELRAGGMVCETYDRKMFDPSGLDALFTLIGQIYGGAAAG